MEIVLNTVEGKPAPSDLYVGLRIGDAQKQGKIVPSRTYCFPEPEKGKDVLGRIEIFQRVGHKSFKIDTNGQVESDLEVSCALPGLDALRFKWSAKGVPQTSYTEKHGRTRKKLEGAQKYIAEHNLEDVLADAMRGLIREQPDNPAKYLSAQMQKLEPISAKPTVPKLDKLESTMLPAVPPKAAKEKLPPIDKERLSDPALKSVAPAIPPQAEVSKPKLSEIATEPPAKSVPAPTQGKQTAADFRTIPPNAFQKIHSMFGKAQEQKLPVQTAVLPQELEAPPVAPSRPVAMKMEESDMTQLQKSAPTEPKMVPVESPVEKIAAPKPAFDNFSLYYRNNFCALAPSFSEALYAQFKIASPSVPKTTPTPPVSAVSNTSPAPPQPAFDNFSLYYRNNFCALAPSFSEALYAQFKITSPSVPKTTPTPPVSAVSKTHPAPPKPAFEDFASYYRSNFCALAPSFSEALYAQFPIATPSASSEALPTSSLLPESSRRTAEAMQTLPSTGTWWEQYPLRFPPDSIADVAPEPWIFRPSVGSWLRPAGPVIERPPEPVVEAPPEPWFHRPSVASWMRRPDPEVARPWHFKKVEGPHATYIQSLQGLLSQRDREIEVLRRQLESRQKNRVL